MQYFYFYAPTTSFNRIKNKKIRHGIYQYTCQERKCERRRQVNEDKGMYTSFTSTNGFRTFKKIFLNIKNKINF